MPMPMEAADFGAEDLNTSGGFLSFLSEVAYVLERVIIKPPGTTYDPQAMAKRLNQTILTKRASGKDGVKV